MASAGQSRLNIETDVPEPAAITVQDLKALLDTAATLTILDVRLRASYESGHIPGAISLPIDELVARIAEIPRGGLLVCYCSGSA